MSTPSPLPPSPLDIAGADSSVKEAQETVNLYLAPGVGAERSVQAYSETSDKYDQYLDTLGYSGHGKVAQAIADLYPDTSQREKVRILDVAAGTGLVGVKMHALGFRHMDGLDPSQGMLDKAAKTNVYTKLYNEYIDDRKLPIDDNSYDSIVIAGGMGQNQIPCEALHEMIRLVKPGGYIVNVTRVEHMTSPWYSGRLEPLMDGLERDRRWTQVTKTTFPNFLTSKEGLLLVHRVL